MRLAVMELTPHDGSLGRRKLALICLSIFLFAVAVRFFHYQDNHHLPFMAGLTAEYRSHAQLVREGEIKLLIRGPNPADESVMAHPPGYPILMAGVFSIFGDSDKAMQFVQIACDAALAVLIFFVAAELLPVAVAIIAAIMVAISPQLAQYSGVLLPDSIAVAPIVLAIYFLVRASRRPRVIMIMASGILIGLSCWLRPNAILLGPFTALAIPLLFERGKRARYALALLGAMLLTVSPITIRNLVVFRRFVPISLGAGITLVEGIGDYDKERRFGQPSTDVGTANMESKLYGRADYANSLYSPDGVNRERARIARGLAVIRAHPFWFGGVMLRRCNSMLKLASVTPMSPEPATTHSLTSTAGMQPIRTILPAELVDGGGLVTTHTEVSVAADGRSVTIKGDDSKWGDQLVSMPIRLQENNDYVLRLPVRIEQGAAIILVTNADRSDQLRSTPILHIFEDIPREKQPISIVQVFFVSRSTAQVRAVFANGGLKTQTIISAGPIEIFELGPASNLWTRYPRILIRTLQRLFVAGWMLLLIVPGIGVLIAARRWKVLALLLVVPVYYLCAQAPLHTESRYVLGIHYFLFILAGVGLYWLIMQTRFAVVTRFLRQRTSI